MTGVRRAEKVDLLVELMMPTVLPLLRIRPLELTQDSDHLVKVIRALNVHVEAERQCLAKALYQMAVVGLGQTLTSKNDQRAMAHVPRPKSV
ncbi:MAG TPA: hypothetical protein VFD92_25875 [Candidatus Binatia bacterium]|nr:hypothetical protein [Candidatus Binatia bacterium]